MAQWSVVPSIKALFGRTERLKGMYATYSMLIILVYIQKIGLSVVQRGFLPRAMFIPC